MPDEFEGDLAGAVFWGADLTGAHFRDVNLTDATITHARLVNIDIDAVVDKVVINGVDVTGYVNERDRWYPLRAVLRPSDPADMQATWATLEDEWTRTISQAIALPDELLHESVNGEWSFAQTLRHVVFAIDKWFTAPIGGAPFTRLGCRTPGPSIFRGPTSAVMRHRLPPTPSPRERSAPPDSASSSRRSRRATSPARSRYSRTGRTRCRNASTPSWRKRSGTTGTPNATSRCSTKPAPPQHRRRRERRNDHRTAMDGGAGGQTALAALSKRVYWPRNTRRLLPIGPLRCFDTITSADPRSAESGLYTSSR